MRDRDHSAAGPGGHSPLVRAAGPVPGGAEQPPGVLPGVPGGDSVRHPDRPRRDGPGGARREEPGWGYKGLPPGHDGGIGDLGSLGWNVLAGDTGTPVAILRASALEHNLAAMAEFCRRHEVSLAPHAKTTMSPELTGMQLAAGAWGLTAAVAHQVAALQAFGARRILLANELTDPGALRWVGELLSARDRPEVMWYVDSLAGVRLAEEALPAAAAGERPRVLVEVGHRNGRTGARTVGEALAVAAAVHRSDRLDLAGVAGFEGTIGDLRDGTGGRGARPLAEVGQFLGLMREVFAALHARGLFLPGAEYIITAGGSAYFDQVVAAFGPLRGLGARIVLRSGCYLSHDDGIYRAASPARSPGWDLGEFEAAIEVWGRVLSRPEQDLALVNVGRRDVSSDAGLPVPRWYCPRGRERAEPVTGMAVTGLSDQHAFVRVPAGHPVAVGDLLGVGISHPCGTFDRWRLMMLTDDDYRVTGAVRTYF